MLDDNKKTERVPVNLTEREFVDACREATRLDKKPAEYIRYLVRKSLYGSVGMVGHEVNEINGHE